MGIRDFVTNARNLRDINRAIRRALGRRTKAVPGVRVLLVEEEPWARQTLTRVLDRSGLEVIPAARASQATALLREQPIDLVIADLAMSERDGVDLIGALRAEHPALRILAIATTHDAVADLDDAREVGASGSIADPFDYTQLVTAVRELLGR